MKQNVLHETGPFAGLLPGDAIRVIYHGAPTSLMVITRVKNYALEGLDGECKCKVTMVTPTDLRFYGMITETRQTVLRPVGIVKVKLEEK